jgi:cytochrome c
MKPVMASIIAACALFSGAALAQSGEAVVKSKGCANCHASGKMAPEFKAIAAKHKGDKNAEATLVAKLRDGKGHPKIQASDAELHSAVQFVLKQ